MLQSRPGQNLQHQSPQCRRLLLRQPDLATYRLINQLAILEMRKGYEVSDLVLGIGRPEEHLFEYQSCDEGIDPAQLHLIHVIGEFHICGLLAHIHDQRLSSWPQYSEDFIKHPYRFRKILECRSADGEVKGTIRERHRGSVALSKRYMDVCRLRLFFRNLHKRFAYVQSD